MDNELGKYLEAVRAKKNLTLREAAEKSGLSHTYIRDIELGMNRKTKAPIEPSPDTLSKIANAYDIPYEDLMEKAGYITKQELFIKAVDEGLNVDIDGDHYTPEIRKILIDLITSPEETLSLLEDDTREEFLGEVIKAIREGAPDFIDKIINNIIKTKSTNPSRLQSVIMELVGLLDSELDEVTDFIKWKKSKRNLNKDKNND